MILVTKHPSFTSDDDDDDDDDAFDALKGRRSNNESSVATLTPRPFARPQMHACIDYDDDDDDDDLEKRNAMEEEEEKRKKRPKSSSRRRSIVSLATLRRRRRRRRRIRIQNSENSYINKKGKKEDAHARRIFSFFFSFFLSR